MIHYHRETVCPHSALDLDSQPIGTSHRDNRKQKYYGDLIEAAKRHHGNLENQLDVAAT